jgi:hypothetical protein
MISPPRVQDWGISISGSSEFKVSVVNRSVRATRALRRRSGVEVPRFSSFNMSMSRAWSATIFLSLVLLEPRVLLLELLEPLGVVGLHAAVPVAPAVPGRLGNLALARHLLDVLTLAEQFFALGEQAEDLFRAVPASLHVV